MNEETIMSGAAGLTPLDPEDGIGVRVKVTDTHVIDVIRQLYNWRVVATPKDSPYVYDAGYCYYGTGRDSYVRAVLGAAAWEGPGHGDPPGWDKNAFTGEYANER